MILQMGICWKSFSLITLNWFFLLYLLIKFIYFIKSMQILSFCLKLLLSASIILIALNNLEPESMRSKSNFISKSIERLKTISKIKELDRCLIYLNELIYTETVLFILSGVLLLLSPKLSRFFFFLGLTLNFTLINNYHFYRNENVLKNMSFLFTMYGGTCIF